MSVRVVLKRRRARPFFARHPWVYADSIDRVEGDSSAGVECRVESAEGVFVARGLLNPDSKLRVRLYSWSDVPLDQEFWGKRLARGIALRRMLSPDAPLTARRLIFSEGDGLSGLAVDQYDAYLVVQVTSRALWQYRSTLLSLLREQIGCRGLVCRFDPALAQLEGMPQPAPEIVGDLPDGPVEILEGDVRFLVDVAGAQKTGFYLDQSLNRAAVAVYAGGKSMLDAFCYTGGFGLHAARAGARHVVGVDSSQPAIARARENSALNGFDDVEHQEADVFEFLQARATSGDRFQLVICDPPKFARHARDLDDAIGGYVRLNQAAVRVLEPDGILATCSCSGHVDRIMFVQMLAHVAELSGRSIQILELRGQAPDHPVSVSCPESDYLKCAICRVV